MTEKTIALDVRILDKEYKIGCVDGEENALMAAARHLDKTMRDIRTNGKVIGGDRIAVMAALNLAHELLQYRESTEASVRLASSHIELLTDKIDAALNETVPLNL